MDIIEMIISNASFILIAVCAVCVLISVITEFTKEIGFLKKIPTMLQVLILSIIICVVVFFAFIAHMHITFVWYYLVAIIFLSFIIAIITSKGWDYLIEIVKRFYRTKDDIK